MDARIISLDDEVTVLPPGEVGELVLKGPQVMKGYHNMPTETANALRDGWLYTGDIARMDEDGFFYIVDRKKELIKPGGYQVWPRECGRSADQASEGVGSGRGWCSRCHIAARRSKPGWCSNQVETATEEEIRDFCKENMAPFKVPTQVEFRTELPKTTVGKILRRELVRQHKEANP